MTIPRSRRLDFTEIPVVDLSRLVAGERDADGIAALGKACRDIGFVYIENHGIAQVLIDDLLRAAADFFARSESEKQGVTLDQRVRGFLPMHYRSYEGEPVAATQKSEGFWIGRERPLNPVNRMDGPNQWPVNSAELRYSMETCFEALRVLAVVLQKAFALALGQPENFFQQLFEHCSSSMLINHYPPQDNPQSVNNIGLTPHTDDGGFTILWQDDKGGLEIESKNGEWVVAPPIPGTFVINLGDVMQIWSNGEFSSTPHRVINRSGVDRYSIPYFANPRGNVPVKPLIGDPGAYADAPAYADYQLDSWRRTFPIAGIPS